MLNSGLPVKERGILFTAPMVRALLDGSKTQTRRVLKVRCQEIGERDDGSPWPWSEHPDTAGDYWHACPYGQAGDRLWVRETWQGPLFGNDDVQAYQDNPESFNQPRYCEYAADGGPTPEFMTPDDELVCRWRPSIHMPRWASRILLEITSVRVERLQDINEADAIAEGIARMPCAVPDTRLWKNYDPGNGCTPSLAIPQNSYRTLWESINGTDSWDANPWVWVVEFKRVTP